jgi:hypothetical protein
VSFRKWSHSHLLERPRTPDVLWPHDARPYKPPPHEAARRTGHHARGHPRTAQMAELRETIRRRPASRGGAQPRSLVSLGHPDVRVRDYRAEHLGYRGGDHGQQLLAGHDAQALVREGDRERAMRTQLAARHAEKSGQFVTVAAQEAVNAPEIFSLRMIRADEERR